MVKLPTIRVALVLAIFVFAGSQRAQGQTVIDTIQQLEDIGNNLSGNYVLGANINASTFNFIPIGGASGFVGTLNGDGYTISGLTIKTTNPADPVAAGLFGAIGTGGLVENVGLVMRRLISAAPALKRRWAQSPALTRER